jgi:sucrose-6-phosphate hydrolase SacC (GH32 family)
VPTQRWRGAMTIPRELKLVKTSRGSELHSLPAAELAVLRKASSAIARQTVSGKLELTPVTGRKPDLMELKLNLNTRDAGVVTLTFANAEGQHTRLAIDKLNHRYTVDRAASGAVDFSRVFRNLQVAPLEGDGREVSLHIFLDHASLEIFINDGATVFTTIFFPTTPYDTVSLTADKDIAVDSGTVYTLKSIWDQN